MLLEIKKCGRKTYIPYWITIVVSNTFFFPAGISATQGYHGTTVNPYVLRQGNTWCNASLRLRKWMSRTPRIWSMKAMASRICWWFFGPNDSRKMKKWWLWLVSTGHVFPAILMLFDVVKLANHCRGSNPRVLLRLSFDLYLDDKADNALPVVFPNVYQGCVLGVRYHFSSRLWLYGEVTALMNQPESGQRQLISSDWRPWRRTGCVGSRKRSKKTIWMFLKTVVCLLTIGRLPLTSQIDIDAAIYWGLEE